MTHIHIITNLFPASCKRILVGRPRGLTGRKNEFASNLPCANMLQIWNLQSFATSAKVAIAEFASFCANSAIATFALVAKLCKFHICNIFAQGKFDANLFLISPTKCKLHM